MKQKNLHAEHRLRMKQRFRDEGLGSFSDHEVLELLLFFGIPYKNTNEIGHRLLNRFGSVSGVLEADYESLLEEPGIGENAATLLILMPELFRRYSMDKNSNSEVYKNVDQVGEYLVNHYIGATGEKVDLLLFDAAMHMIDRVTIHEGSLSTAAVNAELVAEIIFSHRVTYFILAHNHPSGILAPSDDDLLISRELYHAFLPFNKYMLDHIVVAEGKYLKLLKRSLELFDE